MMKSLKAENSRCLPEESVEQKVEQVAEKILNAEEFPDRKRGAKLRMDGTVVVQGMLWHEILSEPMCKRRRKR